MSEDTRRIIEGLQHKNRLTESLGDDAIRMVKKTLAPVQFIEKVTKEAASEDCLRCGGQPFCRLYLAFAYLELEALSMAKALVEEAIAGFRIRGMDRNQAMSHWLQAVILLEEGNNDSAERSINKALDVLEPFLKELRLESHYRQATECEGYIKQIQKALRSISHNARKAPAIPEDFAAQTQDVSNVESTTVTEEVSDYLTLPWLPIYQDVRAGKSGLIELTVTPKNDYAEVRNVFLDNHKCMLHLLRKQSSQDHQISLARDQDGWGWAKVQGHSMNQSKPFPIQNDDYVLFHKQRNVENADIVIASKPKTRAEEYPYMVKRYTASDKSLSSETSEKGDEFLPIPLSQDFQILGVVWAVARKIGSANP